MTGEKINFDFDVGSKIFCNISVECVFLTNDLLYPAVELLFGLCWCWMDAGPVRSLSLASNTDQQKVFH